MVANARVSTASSTMPIRSGSKSSSWFTVDDFKASFNLFCCVCGIGSLAMPANYARAGPVYASIALAFMAFANTYTTVALSKVLLVAPSSVKTYGDVGEWTLGKWGRWITVISQMGVCLLVPIAFLVMGSTLLDVLFPDSFGQIYWIFFMAITVMPICLIPTLKESAGMAFAGCLGTIIADVIGISLLQYNMSGHPTVPSPDVSLGQVLDSFGSLALAYGAAIIVPDLHREHPQPQRMPNVVMVTIVVISIFFVVIAVVGYTAGGCQLSGNLLYSFVDTDSPLSVSPLGFIANRGAVIMAYLFMQVHITMAFATLLQPPFYMAERMILGMHKAPTETFAVDDQTEELQEKRSYVLSSTPQRISRGGSVTSTSHGALESGFDTTENGDEEETEYSLSEYQGSRNVMRYIGLRIVIILILVAIAIAARSKFLDLEDFTGASAHTTSCLIMPMIMYLKVFWRSLPKWEKLLSMLIIVICFICGLYAFIVAGEHLFTPSDDDATFPYCSVEYQNEPYYIRNNSTN
jgi:vesicular inhibitory amino acid transporter